MKATKTTKKAAKVAKTTEVLETPTQTVEIPVVVKKAKKATSPIPELTSVEDKLAGTPVQPEVKKYVNPWANKEKDAYGFITGTKSSLIVSLVASKKYTKDQILEELNTKYPGKNNKVTLACLLTDLQKPVGTYPASRGMVIVENKKKQLSIQKTK